MPNIATESSLAPKPEYVRREGSEGEKRASGGMGGNLTSRDTPNVRELKPRIRTNGAVGFVLWTDFCNKGRKRGQMFSVLASVGRPLGRSRARRKGQKNFSVKGGARGKATRMVVDTDHLSYRTRTTEREAQSGYKFQELLGPPSKFDKKGSNVKENFTAYLGRFQTRKENRSL